MTSVWLPTVDEILRSAEVVSLPMRTRFRGQTEREVMLFHGPAGWGEFGPFPEYGPAEAAPWLAAGVEAAFTGLNSGTLDGADHRASPRSEIVVNATVPAVTPGQVPAVLNRYGDLDSVRAVKIKVAEPGQRLEDCLARVRAVRSMLPHAGLRVDANGAWSLAEASQALARIVEAADGLEYAEQPVAGIEPLAQLREQLQLDGTEVRIAADEAVRKAEDPLRVARLGAAELIVVKAAPLGGVTRALDVVERSGLDAVVSSALETSVGLSAGLALAAQLPRLPYACGLGTVTLFESELVEHPLVPVQGRIQVPRRATEQGGMICAPTPLPELIARHRVGQERQQWWHRRVRDAHAVLSARA